MNTIEKKREAFKDLLIPRTKEEDIEHRALILAALFLHDISEVMEKRNMRLKDLAELLGVSKPYVTQVFRGDKLPNFKFIARVQMALNIKFQVSATSISNKPVATQLEHISK